MIPLFIGVAAGLALWLAGVKLVRIVFISIGAAVGGFSGAVLIPLTGLPAFHLGPVTLNPGFTGLIVGGVIGSLVALGMLRVVITFTAAGAFAVAGAMAALIFLNVRPTLDSEGRPIISDPAAEIAEAEPPLVDFSDQINNRAAEELTDAVNGLSDRVPADSAASELLEDLNTEENRELIRNAAERSKAFVKNAVDSVKREYDARPARDKLILSSATLAGLALGLLMGAVMPKRSSALVTSLFGSAMWMGAGVALLRANSNPAPDFINQPPMVWAVAWGVVTVIGMAVQFGLIKRPGSGGSDNADDED